MELQGPLLFVVVAVLGVGGLIVQFLYKQWRRGEWQKALAKHGLTWTWRDETMLRLPFDLLRKGDGREIGNVGTGTWHSLDVKLFEYTYWDNRRDSKGNQTRESKNFTCCAIPLRDALPHIEISREGLLSRLSDHIGMRDIEFESDEFNRRFQVSAKDRRFATYLIDARMMEYLLSMALQCTFEIEQRWLWAYVSGHSPSEAVRLLPAVKGFGEQIPSVVWDVYASKDEK